MPELTQEEFDALLQFIMSGAFATSSTPSTGLNLYQDIISQLFSEDAAILNNQIWQPYQVYTPFNPAGLTNTIDTYIQNGDPVWSTVAAGIKAGKYTRADAVNYVANELASGLDAYSSNILTEKDVKDEIDRMFEEKKNLDAAEAQYIKDAEEFNRTNAYGSRNLPQATDVWGLEAGPGVVPAPVSQVSQQTIDFVNEMQRQIDESGLESFVAGKDDATRTRMVALAKEMVKEKGLLREDDQKINERNDRIRAQELAEKKERPGTSSFQDRMEMANLEGSNNPVYTEVPLAIKMLANFNLNPRQDSPNQLGASFGAGQVGSSLFSDPAVAAVLAQATGDINRRYAPQENKLRSMQIRQAEAMRNLDTFRQADLENINKKGISPTQYAKNERSALGDALMSALLSFGIARK